MNPESEAKYRLHQYFKINYLILSAYDNRFLPYINQGGVG